ncbi:hypothetical protein [Phormidium sp. CCY1219]|uniref:hypothetical protein n=1 Tax=Phormidium sp. CCY1219 TaxID=2886104 RepID=UPI002D1E60B8|nr:hypothetical protein [Phormidium sp. CCY1219]MEB3827863.1 hypothetical protein [Phormidium sp. CCY1219]
MDAVRGELRQILQEGDVFSGGEGEVKELRSRLIRINAPRERVIIYPRQNYNIFACLFATLSAIAGHIDPPGLSHYLPGNPPNSQTLQGRYAASKTLRQSLGGDPLQDIAQTLQASPNNGTAILTLGDRNCATHTCLHFLTRAGKLHLNVILPAAQILSDFAEFETFKWSVLQEIIARWTNTKLGECSYFIAAFQAASTELRMGKSLLKNTPEKTLYQFGIAPAELSASRSAFDQMMWRWIEIESGMRQGENGLETAIDCLADEFIKTSLQLLYVYNRYRHGESVEEIAKRIEKWPNSDLKVAAIAYFAEEFNRRDFITLSEKESEYFDNLWGEKKSAHAYSFSEIYQVLSILHYKKTLVYKNSWKKHGEALGVFAGISRKYDRLETIFTENVKPTADESILDTFADLAVYSTKYLTYLAEHYPAMFEEFVRQYPPVEPLENYWHNEGFDPVAKILIRCYESAPQLQEISSYRACFEAIQEKYKELEEIFVQGDWKVADPRKCSLSAELGMVSVHYLVLASRQEPERVEKFARAIENL